MRKIESADEQCKRRELKRIKENDELIKCLICNMKFIKVGSHVVQKHGYENAKQYRKEFGLSKRESTTNIYRKHMKDIARNSDNLINGKDSRFKKGGNHGERVKEYWKQKRNNKEITV